MLHRHLHHLVAVGSLRATQLIGSMFVMGLTAMIAFLIITVALIAVVTLVMVAVVFGLRWEETMLRLVLPGNNAKTFV